MTTTKPPDVRIRFNTDEVLVYIGDLLIAKRPRPGTPHGGAWISLEPGWRVFTSPDFKHLTFEYNSVPVQ